MTATRKGKPAKPAEKAIQFKVQLRYIRPPIWRRVVLPDNATLGDLHAVIQTTMGWYNSHMHSFRIGGVYYTSRSASQMEDMDMENEERVPLAEVVTRAKQKFIYEYDFGDSWEHESASRKTGSTGPRNGLANASMARAGWKSVAVPRPSFKPVYVDLNQCLRALLCLYPVCIQKW